MEDSSCADNSSYCLICNTGQSAGDGSFALDTCVGDDCSVSECLTAILGRPLLALAGRCSTVCGTCRRLLQEVYTLECRAWTLRRSVRRSFVKNCRGSLPDQDVTPSLEVDRWDESLSEEETRFHMASADASCERCAVRSVTEGVVHTAQRNAQQRERVEEPIVQIQVLDVERPGSAERTVSGLSERPPADTLPGSDGGHHSQVSSEPSLSAAEPLHTAAPASDSTSVGDGGGDRVEPAGPGGPASPVDHQSPASPASRPSLEGPASRTAAAPRRQLRRRPPAGAGEPSPPTDLSAGDDGDRPAAGDSAGPALRRRPRRRPRTQVLPEDGDDLDDIGAGDDADLAGDGARCAACGVDCADTTELAQHRARCGSAVLWSCALCDRTFRHLPQLKRHTRQHQLPTRLLAVCLKCGLACADAAALAEHAAAHAADAADILVCGVCGRGFRAEAELTAHSVAHTVTCTVCHKQLRRDSLREHMRRHTGETPYGCDECGKRFVAFSSLRAHRRTHTGDKPHKCHLCAEMFHLKQSLAEHLERHENKTLRCELCAREFPSSRRLAAHVKTHDRRRWQPHTCEFCGDGFMTKRSLRAHRVRHTGPLPYHCDICGKGFTYEDTYKEHLSVHSGQRPFTCEVCGKSYGRRSCLWAHRNQHTNPNRFTCTHCGKLFSNQSTYNVHLRIHTGERPYSCSSCSASFRLLTSLKRHTCSGDSGPPTAAPAPAPVQAPPIQVQICTPGGGAATAQIQLPAVPPLYAAPWQPPPPGAVVHQTVDLPAIDQL